MTLIIGDKQIPLFGKDTKIKNVEKLKDELDKVKTQLTFCSNTLSYAFKLLDNAGLNTPEHQKNMEALLQGKDIDVPRAHQ